MLTFRKESFLRTLQKEGHLDDFFLALLEEKDMDRATVGLAFLSNLGVKSSRTAVYEAFRLHCLDWQQDLAVRTAENTPNVSGLEEKLQRLIKQRTFETVARPDLKLRNFVSKLRNSAARLLFGFVRASSKSQVKRLGKGTHLILGLLHHIPRSNRDFQLM